MRSIGLLLVAGIAAFATFDPVQPDLFGAGGTFANAWADHDGDGDLDLFVGFNGEPNRLYLNDGGVFRDVAATAGIADARPTRAVAWGDYDGDGDADLLVGFAPGAGSVLRLYRNDGGRFVDVTDAANLGVDSAAVRQPAWVDFDDDGDLDLFVAFRDRANALYRNDGARFTDIAGEVGLADTRRSVGATWFDYDADGDLDLVVGNMDGDANALMRNDRGRFTDIAEAAGVAWGGRAAGESSNGTVRPCAADVDGDGRLDLFFANYGPNGLFLNRGESFVDASEQWGIALDSRYDSCAFADFDNDGRLDLYVNGTVTGGVSYPDHLYRNTGRAFEEVTPDNLAAFQADHGVQWADFDGDGAIDLALTGARPDGTHALLRNTTAGGSVQVRVVDDEGRAHFAGAEVHVFDAATGERIGMRVIDAGSGYDSQSDSPAHIGTGAATRVNIEVAWPGAGTRRVATREGVAVAEWLGRVIPIELAAPTRFRQTQTDDYTRYELLEPGSASFRILYDVSATTAGASYYFNTIRQGAEEEVHGVTDLHTGRPLESRVVDGVEAGRMGLGNASPTAHYIAVTLARPVPEGGQGRVRIDKTYRDTASYFVDGDRIVFARSLGIDRNAVVLPAGWELISCNVPVQVDQESDGRIRASFMNASAAAAPLRIEARRMVRPVTVPPARRTADPPPMTDVREPAGARVAYTFPQRAFEDRDITYFLQQPETHSFRLFHDYTETRPGMDRYLNVVRAGSKATDPEAVILDTGERLRVETLKGDAITARGIDIGIGGGVSAATEVVVIWFDPVPAGGSVRLRITETYTDPNRYVLAGDELVWDRGFGRPRNTVVLPDGWYLTANAVPAAISQLEDGRIRLRYINERPGNIEVFVRARRR